MKKPGCIILACCYAGGLTTYDQCISAYPWASKNGKINGADCFCSKGFRNISEHFGINFMKGCKFVRNKYL